MTVPATVPVLYLLDTNILVHYIRGSRVYQNVEATYHLLSISIIPLISYVTEAEVRSLGIQLGWGTARMNQLGFLLTAFQSVLIHESGILEAYIAIDSFSRTVGIDMGKNDLWIAATAHVTGAILVTTDKDFDHLHGRYLLRDWVDPSL